MCNNNSTISLKAGKKYVTRNGLITNPLTKSNNGTSYMFESKVNEPEFETPSVRCWLGNGKFLTSNVDHRLDLIAEI